MMLPLLALIGLHLGSYFFYAFGAVHDFGSYYQLFWLPALALIAARVIVVAPGELAGNAAAAATLVGLATFVPTQVVRLRALSELINEPVALVRGAAESAPLIVFYDRATPWNSSWVFWSDPPASPSDRILWSREGNLRTRAEVAARYPDRLALQLDWVGGHAQLHPFVPPR
jgi:hypothetical protein